MTRHRDKSKDVNIRKKALKMIVREGLDGLSMHKLARSAKISPATIYIYFKDRDDLILQIGIEEELKMFEATLEGFDAEMAFEKGLRIQWTNRAKYFLENPEQMHFMEQLKYSKFNELIITEVKKDFINIMSRFLHRAIENKELVKLPIEVYWSVAFAPLYQLVKFHINKKGMHGRSFSLDQKKLDLALSLVIKGLKP